MLQQNICICMLLLNVPTSLFYYLVASFRRTIALYNLQVGRSMCNDLKIYLYYFIMTRQ